MKARVAFEMTMPDGSVVSNSIPGTEFDVDDFQSVAGDPLAIPSITVESAELAQRLRDAADIIDPDRIPA